MTTIQEAAQQAIAVQDACNLSGVARSFVTVIDVLRAQGGADWAQHPIVTLFLDKMLSLNRTQCLCSQELENYGKAWDQVEAIAGGAK